MSATFDDAIQISVSLSPGQVYTADFGVLVHVTEDVGVGFTERIRYYNSPQAVENDSDLDPAAVTAVLSGFAQSNRLRTMAVGKIAYASGVAAELSAIEAAALALGIPFYFLETSTRTEADILAAAAWQETRFGLYLPQTGDADALNGVGGNVLEDLSGFGYTRTAASYHLPDTESLALGWGCDRGAADPDVTSTIWRHAPLVGFSRPVVDDTQKAAILGNFGNFYAPFRGQLTMGKGRLASGNPIDTRIARDWLEARLNESVAALLIAASARLSKVAYDDNGLNQIANEFEKVLERGVAAGHLLEGAQIVQIPTRASSADADITARIGRYPLKLTLAGAVEEVDIDVEVSFA